MPDLEDTQKGEPDTPVDAAQGAPETETETPPWGDDFDAGKAWNTITQQRASEKELKEELRRLREDEDAYRQHGAEKFGFQFGDPDDADDDDDALEVEDDEDEAVTKRLTAVEQAVAAREAQEREAAFKRDVNELAAVAEIELDDDDRDWIGYRASQDPKGFNKESVERAVNALVARDKAREQAAIERFRGSKKAPHVTPKGSAATQVPDLDDTEQRHRWLRERVSQQASST